MPPCLAEVSARAACHSAHGKNNELCLQQELLEKRCLSRAVCPAEALGYYGGRHGEGWTCGDWAEAFAFFGSERAMLSREVVEADKEKKGECRRRAYELGRCLLGKRGEMEAMGASKNEC